jgi:hypothetical protein
MNMTGQRGEQSDYIWRLQWNETHYYSKANCIRNKTSEVKLVTLRYMKGRRAERGDTNTSTI